MRDPTSGPSKRFTKGELFDGPAAGSVRVNWYREDNRFGEP
jgi:hypothetical protein